jgi:hypothetical protein
LSLFIHIYCHPLSFYFGVLDMYTRMMIVIITSQSSPPPNGMGSGDN